jgi:hypothetical protein
MIPDYNNNIDYSKYVVEGYPVRHRKKNLFQSMFTLSLNYRSIIKEIREADAKLDNMILGDEDYLRLVNDAYSTNIHWSVNSASGAWIQEL